MGRIRWDIVNGTMDIVNGTMVELTGLVLDAPKPATRSKIALLGHDGALAWKRDAPSDAHDESTV